MTLAISAIAIVIIVIFGLLLESLELDSEGLQWARNGVYVTLIEIV
jgi:hypothetical protein